MKKKLVFSRNRSKKNMKVKILQIIHMFHFLNILKLCEKKVTLESGKTKLINHCETYFSSVYQQPIQKKNGKEI